MLQPWTGVQVYVEDRLDTHQHQTDSPTTARLTNISQTHHTNQTRQHQPDSPTTETHQHHTDSPTPDRLTNASKTHPHQTDSPTADRLTQTDRLTNTSQTHLQQTDSPASDWLTNTRQTHPVWCGLEWCGAWVWQRRWQQRVVEGDWRGNEQPTGPQTNTTYMNTALFARMAIL